MADEIKERQLEQAKQQEVLVRKLKTIKTDDIKDFTNSWDIVTELRSINNDFADVSYVCGWVPTIKDTVLFDFCVRFNDQLSEWPHLKRWFKNIQSFSKAERVAFPDPEGPVTSLANKVDYISNLCLSEQNNRIDRKVREAIASLQANSL